MASKQQSTADRFKDAGNQHFSAKRYDDAIRSYSEAIEVCLDVHVYWSNRSAAHSGKADFSNAEADAKQCVTINPQFVKGWYRLAAAQKELSHFKDCETSCRSGLRADSANADLIRLLAEVVPMAEREEKRRRAGVNSRAEQLKDEGNDHYKTSAYPKAITSYTQAIGALTATERTAALAVSIYNNRAACYQQLNDEANCIADASHALEIDPANVKALLRRGLAYEQCERYRSALQDIRAVLAIDPSIEMANKAQHRIGQAVRQLKEEK